MQIRNLADEDIPRLVELEKILFPGDNPWTEYDFRSEIHQPHTYYLGMYAVDDVLGGELLVGYAGMAQLGPAADPEFEIHTIGVDPAFHRRGIARALLERLLAVAVLPGGKGSAPVFLEVRTDNNPAITLYESCGFVRAGLRKRYYQPSGADAYTMIRPGFVPDE